MVYIPLRKKTLLKKIFSHTREKKIFLRIKA